GAARRQYRERMRVHAAVSGTRNPLPPLPRQGPRRARLPRERLRWTGAGQQRRDRKVLRAQLRRELPDVREVRRFGEQRQSLLRVASAQDRRASQLELSQVPRRSVRRDGAVLRQRGRAGRRQAGRRNRANAGGGRIQALARYLAGSTYSKTRTTFCTP